MTLLAAFHRGQGDDLERQAAKVLLDIDGMLKLFMMYNVDGSYNELIAQVREVRVRAQDAVLLLCSRFIDRTAEALSRRISYDLKQRLNIAFENDVSKDIDLWARLGNTRHQIFMKGIVSGRERKDRREKERNKNMTMIPRSVNIGGGDSRNDDRIVHPTDSPMYINDLMTVFSNNNV